eukprot:2835571-Pleurochrysis_carterae.AAC.2
MCRDRALCALWALERLRQCARAHECVNECARVRPRFRTLHARTSCECACATLWRVRAVRRRAVRVRAVRAVRAPACARGAVCQPPAARRDARRRAAAEAPPAHSTRGHDHAWSGTRSPR